jgi:hypothetical protein
MSTQRRAKRTTSSIEIDRVDVRRRWFRACMERAGISVSAARTGSALGDITAPLMSIFWLAWVWFSTPATKACRRGPRLLRTRDKGSRETTDRVATDSLLSDHHNETLARLDCRSGSPPPGGVGSRGHSVPRGTRRSSPLHIPFLPVRTRLRPTLPHAPAGEIRWAERHDGKRDLYFQHAA